MVEEIVVVIGNFSRILDCGWGSHGALGTGLGQCFPTYWSWELRIGRCFGCERHVYMYLWTFSLRPCHGQDLPLEGIYAIL